MSLNIAPYSCWDQGQPLFHRTPEWKSYYQQGGDLHALHHLRRSLHGGGWSQWETRFWLYCLRNLLRIWYDRCRTKLKLIIKNELYFEANHAWLQFQGRWGGQESIKWKRIWEDSYLNDIEFKHIIFKNTLDISLLQKRYSFFVKAKERFEVFLLHNLFFHPVELVICLNLTIFLSFSLIYV